MPNAEALRGWIGRSERRTDIIVPWPLAALAATLDDGGAAPEMGAPVPPGGHWLYFLDATPLTRTGPDGHPLRGGFMPPVQLPRRMWAGGRLTFVAPLRVGDTAQRLSEVTDVQVKQGRTGELVFVQVRHTIGTARGVAMVEEHDIVFRDHDEPGAPARAHEPAPTDATWTRTLHPSPVLLFRYSALTFNGHRIHYDRPYAAEEEGYPGLLVHGPLMATLLLDLVRRWRPDAAVGRFWYRAMAPVFDTTPFTLNGRPDGDRIDLWVTGPAGELAMRAEATLA